MFDGILHPWQGRKVKNKLRPFDNQLDSFKIADIRLVKNSFWIEVLALAARKIVNFFHFVTPLNKRVCQMAADKTGSANHYPFRFFYLLVHLLHLTAYKYKKLLKHKTWITKTKRIMKHPQDTNV